MLDRHKFTRFFNSSPDDLVRYSAEHASPLGKSLEKLLARSAAETKAGWRFCYELYRPLDPKEVGRKNVEPPSDPEAAAREEDLTESSNVAPFWIATIGALSCFTGAFLVAIVLNKSTLHGSALMKIGLGGVLPASFIFLKVTKLASKIGSPSEMRAVADGYERERRTAMAATFLVLVGFALLRSYARFVAPGITNLVLWSLEAAFSLSGAVSLALALIHWTPGHRFALGNEYAKHAHRVEAALDVLGEPRPAVTDTRSDTSLRDSTQVKDGELVAEPSRSPNGIVLKNRMKGGA